MGARLQVKAREKWAEKTGSRDDESPPPEENHDNAWEDGNAEALTCAFTVTYIQFRADHICCRLKAMTTMV
jgi:hypothetical protein